MSQSPLIPTFVLGENDRYSRAWGALRRLLVQGRSFSGRETNCCFLNTGGGRFADVSALSGVDLPDDGRGLAVVDWDHDGDLDLWTANRTGPRVRFFRNEFPPAHRFLAVRLEGKTCNRDAIGARLELDFDGGRIIKSLRAGDAFASQSSKCIHFGLGDAKGDANLTIRWPGGDVQRLTSLALDRRYVVVQGADSARPLAARTGIGQLPSSSAAPLATKDGTRVILPGRPLLPDLKYVDFDGNTRHIDDHAEKPVLLILWSISCPACAAELADIARHGADLKAAGLDVVALSVDAIASDGESQPDQVRAHLDELDFPFRGGLADKDLVHQLDVFQKSNLARERPLALPSGFLLDADARAVVLYRGVNGPQRLVQDAELLDLDSVRLRDQAVPLPGRWYSPPQVAQPESIAMRFLEDGDSESAASYLQRWLSRNAMRPSDSERPRPFSEARLARVQYFLAGTLRHLERFEDAQQAYQKCLELDPNHRPALVESGQLLLESGRPDEAAQALSRAAALQEDDPEVLAGLGLARLQQHKWDEAARLWGEVLRMRPNRFEIANNLAWILATHEDLASLEPDRAVQLAEQACSATNHHEPKYLDTLAAAYAAAGRFDDAVETVNKALGLLKPGANDAVRRGMLRRKQLYEARKPYRERMDD